MGKIVVVKRGRMREENGEVMRRVREGANRNIVVIYGVEKQQDYTNVFMEYLPGGSLS